MKAFKERKPGHVCLKIMTRVCSVPFVGSVSNATSRVQTLHLAMKKNWRNVEENYLPSHLKREEKEKNQILIETSNCSNN